MRFPPAGTEQPYLKKKTKHSGSNKQTAEQGRSWLGFASACCLLLLIGIRCAARKARQNSLPVFSCHPVRIDPRALKTFRAKKSDVALTTKSEGLLKGSQFSGHLTSCESNPLDIYTRFQIQPQKDHKHPGGVRTPVGVKLEPNTQSKYVQTDSVQEGIVSLSGSGPIWGNNSLFALFVLGAQKPSTSARGFLTGEQ